MLGSDADLPKGRAASGRQEGDDYRVERAEDACDDEEGSDLLSVD